MALDMRMVVKINRLSSVNTETLSANKTLVVADYAAQWLDPGGSDRDITLPAEAASESVMFLILNDADGAGEDLVVENDAAATIATLGPGMSGIFSCDGTDWKWESESGWYYDSVNGSEKIINDAWIRAANYAGTDVINMLKVNVDDEIDVGATLVVGTIEAVEDSGMITGYDAPVSATPAAGDEQSNTSKIDGNNVITFGAFADSAGGVTGEFFKTHGARMVHKTDGGAADYNPSALTSDYIVTVDTTAAARAVTISTEDRDSGSASKPRIFIIHDIAGNASANNITVSLETSGTINGAATFVINGDYNSITLSIDGSNGYII